VITLDTSGILALLNRRDPDHDSARTALLEDRGPYLVPAGILAEITYLLERRLGPEVLDAFVADLQSGQFAFECGSEDWARTRELVRRYADLPLGCADASVVACAERSGGKVLTLDRDFSIVARDGRITLLPS
jgi:predicted nucleic acid-binding protein